MPSGVQSGDRLGAGDERVLIHDVTLIVAPAWRVWSRHRPETLCGVTRSAPVDGFVLDYTEHGPPKAPSVVLLRGWPGDSHDYRGVIPRLTDLRTVVPDLRGFGRSDRYLRDAETYYTAAAQARSIAGLIEELGLDQPVLAGYDVTSASPSPRADRTSPTTIPIPSRSSRR